MSSKDPVASTVFKYNGVFNFDEFYKLFRETIEGEGYIIISEADSRKNKGGSDKVEIEWSYERIIDDYTKFTLSVEILIPSLKKVIIKKEGKEIKTSSGNATIIIKGVIITDWQNLWEKSPFLKHLRGFYERYLFKKTLNDYETEVYKDVFSIEGTIKSFFNLPGFM